MRRLKNLNDNTCGCEGPGIPQQHYNPQIAHPGYPAMQAHSGVNGVGRGYTHVGPQGSSPGHAAAGNGMLIVTCATFSRLCAYAGLHLAAEPLLERSCAMCA